MLTLLIASASGSTCGFRLSTAFTPAELPSNFSKLPSSTSAPSRFFHQAKASANCGCISPCDSSTNCTAMPCSSWASYGSINSKSGSIRSSESSSKAFSLRILPKKLSMVPMGASSSFSICCAHHFFTWPPLCTSSSCSSFMSLAFNSPAAFLVKVMETIFSMEKAGVGPGVNSFSSAGRFCSRI